MKRLRFMFCLVMIMSALLSLPEQAFACACCAEPGEYRISYSKPGDYERTLLQKIRFAGVANLFRTAGDLEDDAKGIVNASNKYGLTVSLAGNAWKLTFRDGDKNGTLSLSMPLKMLSYRVDTHATPGSIDPTLYKEWRFEGPVTGTGFFKPGISGPTKYFLVFQGRGNNCDNAEDFTHWRLEITGKRARYAFYGELQKETIVTLEVNKLKFPKPQSGRGASEWSEAKRARPRLKSHYKSRLN